MKLRYSRKQRHIAKQRAGANVGLAIKLSSMDAVMSIPAETVDNDSNNLHMLTQATGQTFANIVYWSGMSGQYLVDKGCAGDEIVPPELLNIACRLELKAFQMLARAPAPIHRHMMAA